MLMRKSKCHWLQRGVSPPILTFDLGLKTPKCHGCCHQTVFCFSFFSFLCVFSCHLGLLQSVHQIQDKHPHHQPALSPLFPLPSVCAYSILMGACVCLGTRCYQRAYAWLRRLIPCSRLVNMFTWISLRSLDRTWGILLLLAPLCKKSK